MKQGRIAGAALRRKVRLKGTTRRLPGLWYGSGQTCVQGMLRMRVLGTAVGLLLLACAGSQAAPNFPPGAESAERLRLAQLDSDRQGWVKEQARNMVSSGRISEDRARSLAQGARMASGADVNTISFLLLMQAARDADADLQAIMDRSREAFADQAERSSMAHNRTPTISQLSPETQTVLSEKGRVKPVMTWHSDGMEGATPSSSAPVADVDTSVHVDLQTAMDREAAAEAAVSAALQRLTVAAP